MKNIIGALLIMITLVACTPHRSDNVVLSTDILQTLNKSSNDLTLTYYDAQIEYSRELTKPVYSTHSVYRNNYAVLATTPNILPAKSFFVCYSLGYGIDNYENGVYKGTWIKCLDPKNKDKKHFVPVYASEKVRISKYYKNIGNAPVIGKNKKTITSSVDMSGNFHTICRSLGYGVRNAHETSLDEVFCQDKNGNVTPSLVGQYSSIVITTAK